MAQQRGDETISFALAPAGRVLSYGVERQVCRHAGEQAEGALAGISWP